MFHVFFFNCIGIDPHCYSPRSLSISCLHFRQFVDYRTAKIFHFKDINVIIADPISRYELPVLSTVDHRVSICCIKRHNLLTTFSSGEFRSYNTWNIWTFCFYLSQMRKKKIVKPIVSQDSVPLVYLSAICVGPLDHFISVFRKSVFMKAMKLNSIVTIILTWHTLLIILW